MVWSFGLGGSKASLSVPDDSASRSPGLKRLALFDLALGRPDPAQYKGRKSCE